MDVREEQYAKLLSPKLVTDVGIVIEVREEQPQKQPSSKLVTEEGIIVFIHPESMVLLSVLIIALQFSRESYKGLLSSTVIDVRAEHPKKHPPPNFVTLYVKPSYVTFSGMITSLVEPLYFANFAVLVSVSK